MLCHWHEDPWQIQSAVVVHTKRHPVACHIRQQPDVSQAGTCGQAPNTIHRRSKTSRRGSGLCFFARHFLQTVPGLLLVSRRFH